MVGSCYDSRCLTRSTYSAIRNLYTMVGASYEPVAPRFELALPDEAVRPRCSTESRTSCGLQAEPFRVEVSGDSLVSHMQTDHSRGQLKVRPDVGEKQATHRARPDVLRSPPQRKTQAVKLALWGRPFCPSSSESVRSTCRPCKPPASTYAPTSPVQLAFDLTDLKSIVYADASSGSDPRRRRTRSLAQPRRLRNALPIFGRIYNKLREIDQKAAAPTCSKPTAGLGGLPF